MIISSIGVGLIVQDPDIAVEIIDPTSHQAPCPNMMLIYECQTKVGVGELLWTITSDGLCNNAVTLCLGFTVIENIGSIESVCDGNITSELTGKIESQADFYFLNSTLRINNPINGTNLSCSVYTDEGRDRFSSTIIAISGKIFTAPPP